MFLHHIILYILFSKNLQRAWFGGDFASIIGECACPMGSIWNDNELRCDGPRPRYFAPGSATSIMPHSILLFLLPLYLSYSL